MSSECMNFFKWCCTNSVTFNGSAVCNVGYNSVTAAIFE